MHLRIHNSHNYFSLISRCSHGIYTKNNQDCEKNCLPLEKKTMKNHAPGIEYATLFNTT